MGLFNFFNKKDKKGKSNQELAKETNASERAKKDDSIEISSIDNGSHGDNFGGLIGFHFLNSPNGGQLINEYIAYAAVQKSNLRKNGLAIHEVLFENTNKLGIRALKAGESIHSAYPYLPTNYTVPFTTKEIIEWSHVDNVEAEIKGGGRDTFGFGFFPTDYAVNKDKYKANKNLDIKVSAIGLVLDKSDLTEIGGHSISADFASYMPNKDIPRPTYYDYIGVLMDFTPITIAEKNKGYLTKVKLINEPENPDFFTVDMFINEENMRIKELEKGMRIGVQSGSYYGEEFLRLQKESKYQNRNPNRQSTHGHVPVLGRPRRRKSLPQEKQADACTWGSFASCVFASFGARRNHGTHWMWAR